MMLHSHFKEYVWFLNSTLIVLSLFFSAMAQNESVITTSWGNIQTADSHRQTGTITNHPIFVEPIVGQDAQGVVKPFLAESFTIEDDRSYLFTFREGTMFHNGRELTADDIKANFERVARIESAWLNSLATRVSELEVVDDLTLRVRLAEPYAPFLALLSELWILAPESPGWDDTISLPIGTGPFKWDSWEPKVELKLVRNENYWQEDLPKVDALSLKVIEGDASIALRAGDIDITGISVSQAEALSNDPNFSIMTTPYTSWTFVSFQNGNPRPPFDDIRVRKAIIHALNKEEICAVSSGRYAIISNQMAGPGSFYEDPDLLDPYRTPNLEEARRLLVEAGVDPSEHTIVMPVNTNATVPQVVAFQLEQLGFKVDLQVSDDTATEIRIQNDDWDLYYAGSGARADIALRFVRMLSDGPNPGLWGNVNDPDYDRLVNQAFQTTDDELRKQLYLDAWKVVMDNLYTTVMCHSPGLIAMSNKVEGYSVGGTAAAHWIEGGIAFTEKK